jgi:phosphohistidine phosphatase
MGTGMRRLILFRHAKSDWPGGLADHERPLGPRGRKDAPRMGEELARDGLRPDLAIVSTAVRTRETWDLAAPFLDDVPVRFERRLYEAAPEAILSVIRGVADSVATLLVLGHNPGLEMTASFLVSEGPRRLRDRLGEKFPTAAIAVIRFSEGGWRDIGQGSGELARFLTPGDIGEE